MGGKGGDITLWMLDAKDPSHKHKVHIIRQVQVMPLCYWLFLLAYKEGIYLLLLKTMVIFQ